MELRETYLGKKWSIDSRHAHTPLQNPRYNIFLGADNLTFEKNFEKKIPATQGERKKMQKRALKKKFLHVNLLTLFTSVLCPHTGLQDFAFSSRHICLKEHGVNSGRQHRDFTAFGPLRYDSQWRSLQNCCPPPGLKICTSL